MQGFDALLQAVVETLPTRTRCRPAEARAGDPLARRRRPTRSRPDRLDLLV